MPETLQPLLQRLSTSALETPALARPRAAVLRVTRGTYRLPRPVVPGRIELPHLLNQRGLLGLGVEVGVKRGEFSEEVLERWKGRRLISVDPWRAAPAEDYVDVANVEQAEHDRYHRETVDRLRRFGERSDVWRMTGAEAAAELPDHSLDFVYLDARHDRESVVEDLETWLPKVRPTGVIAGHDYVDGDFPEGVFGVRTAVDGFFGARGWSVRCTFADPPWISWWTLVPR